MAMIKNFSRIRESTRFAEQLQLRECMHVNGLIV